MHFIIGVGEPHCLRLPACLLACVPACLPTYASVCVYASPACMSSLISASLPIYLHSICLHVCLPGGCTVLNCLFLPISTE